MRLRVARVRFDPGFRQLDGAREMLAELGVEIGGRLLQVHACAREGSEIVIDRDRAALEEHLQPEHAGQVPVRRRLVGCERDGLAQQVGGLLVLVAVGEVGRACAQRFGRFRLRRGRDRKGHERGEDRDDESAVLPGHQDYDKGL